MKKHFPQLFLSIILVLTLTPLVDCVETSFRIISSPREDIKLPQLPGYLTLKCDLHEHTVFSDGKVWPTVRVDEAWREGLDVIAITDHIEYQPHKDDIPTQHNRPYEIVNSTARGKNILLPRGTEITRDTPPGHFNAIFVDDINPLDEDDFLTQIENANKQEGFVFWNHQGWKGSERGRWLEVHTTMYENKWLHGMEVCNGGTYYPDAHQWCLDKNLTMLGNSDIHDPSLLHKSTPEEHRTITLVFAKERTLQSLKEALQARRTAVWYKQQLIGRQEILEPLFYASVTCSKPYLQHGNTYYVEIHNNADIEFILQKSGEHGLGEFTLPPQSTIQVRIQASDPVDSLPFSYTVKNLLIAPEQGLPIEFELPLE